MSDGEENSEEKFDLEFASFLNDYSGMFTVMGVFAALAIYLSRVTEDPIFEAELMIQLGFGAAFVIALLVMFEIYHVLKGQFGSWHRLLHAHFRPRNFDLVVFTICIGIIAGTIYGVLMKQTSVVLVLIFLGVAGVAIAFMLRSPYELLKLTPDTPFWRISIGSIFSISTFAVSHYAFTELTSRFTVSTIQELTFDDPYGILLLMAVTFFMMVRWLASIGILATIISIPIIIIDKIRGVSPYDQPD